jgi:serine/threonine protein kinase
VHIEQVIDINTYPSSLDINTEILLYNLGSGGPGIVELIDVFVDDKRVAMVMELMDGGELFSLV